MSLIQTVDVSHFPKNKKCGSSPISHCIGFVGKNQKNGNHGVFTMKYWGGSCKEHPVIQ